MTGVSYSCCATELRGVVRSLGRENALVILLRHSFTMSAQTNLMLGQLGISERTYIG